MARSNLLIMKSHCEERYINLGVSRVLMRSAAIPPLLNGIDKEIASSALTSTVP